jgi:hypothetical protein
MLPIMATAKKIVAIRRKLDFWERREKRLFSITGSLARSQTLVR